MKHFVAGPNEDGARLSRFVEGVTSGLPASLMYKAFRNRRVKVNGKRQPPEYRLQAGDEIELYINDEFFAEKSAPAKKKQPRLTVVYEDAQIALLYKPAHLLCHSDRTGDANLVDAFRAYLEQKGQYDPHAPARFAPALCNRLDRGTEGLVLAAKTYPALRDANRIIQDDLLEKTYYAITVGAPPEGRHTAYLSHNEKGNRAAVYRRPAEGRRQIITEVRSVQRGGAYALCEIGLVTGRTHQIRAHLAFLKAPVLGDIKYGDREANRAAVETTQCLCAAQIRFKDIPADNVLHDLSGRSFALPDPDILAKFRRLSGQA